MEGTAELFTGFAERIAREKGTRHDARGRLYRGRSYPLRKVQR